MSALHCDAVRRYSLNIDLIHRVVIDLLFVKKGEIFNILMYAFELDSSTDFFVWLPLPRRSRDAVLWRETSRDLLILHEDLASAVINC